MRVGRAALDEDAIRTIQQHHPDIRFDWPQILSGQDEAPRERERDEGRPEPPPRPEPRPAAPAPQQTRVEAEPAPADVAPVVEEATAASIRLGADGLARLRARYADLAAAIARRVPDPERQAELLAEAARLDPDRWTNDDDVTRGLDEYEPVLAAVRSVVGRKRRRRRSRSQARTDQAAPAAGEEARDPSAALADADADADENDEQEEEEPQS